MTSYAVIIGRFQVTNLHAGHRYLFETAVKAHDKLLIILGVSGGQPTERNPLDAKTRILMLQREYPEAVIKTHPDQASDEIWSERLDELIDAETEGNGVIYGSRDCFASHYRGRYPVSLLKEIPMVSGERCRKGINDRPLDDRKFRQGVIYAQQTRFPTSYQTVDIIVYRKETNQILLGRKMDDAGWRFIGGFVDPTDTSLEHAAKRECYEETGGIEVGTPRYIGSARINDHRYRGTTDGVMTAIFAVQYIFGAPQASDDLDELKWVNIEAVEEFLVDNHRIIWKIFANGLEITTTT